MSIQLIIKTNLKHKNTLDCKIIFYVIKPLLTIWKYCVFILESQYFQMWHQWQILYFGRTVIISLSYRLWKGITAKSLCVFLLFLFSLFFILHCMYTRMSLAFILIPLYSLFLVVYIRVCHVLHDFHTSKMLCYILISVHPYFLQF